MAKTYRKPQADDFEHDREQPAFCPADGGRGKLLGTSGKYGRLYYRCQHCGIEFTESESGE